jgi:hypothetical protein
MLIASEMLQGAEAAFHRVGDWYGTIHLMCCEQKPSRDRVLEIVKRGLAISF